METLDLGEASSSQSKFLSSLDICFQISHFVKTLWTYFIFPINVIATQTQNADNATIQTKKQDFCHLFSRMWLSIPDINKVPRCKSYLSSSKTLYHLFSSSLNAVFLWIQYLVNSLLKWKLNKEKSTFIFRVDYYRIL